MDLLVSPFYFITKTNSCLFDIQFHRLAHRTCRVKHCQDWNTIIFDFSKAKILIQHRFQCFSFHIERLCSLFLWFCCLGFFGNKSWPPVPFELTMSFNQIDQAGRQVFLLKLPRSCHLTRGQIFKYCFWLQKASSVLYLFQKKPVNKYILDTVEYCIQTCLCPSVDTCNTSIV